MRIVAACAGIAILLISIALQIMSSEQYRLWNMKRKLNNGQYVAAIKEGNRILRKRMGQANSSLAYPLRISSTSVLGRFMEDAFRKAGQQYMEMLRAHIRKGKEEHAGAAFQRLLWIHRQGGQTFPEGESLREECLEWVIISSAHLSTYYIHNQKWDALATLYRAMTREGVPPQRSLAHLLPQCGQEAVSSPASMELLEQVITSRLESDQLALVISDIYASAASLCFKARKNQEAELLQQERAKLRGYSSPR